MVAINKEEKEIIHKRFPEVHIVRTMRQDSKRHRYYCEEYPPAMQLLRKLRDPGTVKLKTKEGHRS